MPEDILHFDEDENDLSFLELVEALFLYPKGTMEFIHRNEYKKHIGILVTIEAIIFIIVTLLFQEDLFRSVINYFYYVVVNQFYGLVNAAFIILVFGFLCYLFIRMDKKHISVAEVFRLIVYALLVYAGCRLGIALFLVVAEHFLRPDIFTLLFNFSLVAANLWFARVLYFALLPYVKSKSTALIILSVASLITYGFSLFLSLEYILDNF